MHKTNLSLMRFVVVPFRQCREAPRRKCPLAQGGKGGGSRAAQAPQKPFTNEYAIVNNL